MFKELYVYCPNGEISKYENRQEIEGFGRIVDFRTNNHNGILQVIIDAENLKGELIKAWMVIVGLPYVLIK